MSEIPEAPPEKPVMELLIMWSKMAEELKKLRTKEILTRKSIFSKLFPDAVEGTNTHELANDYVLKGTLPYERTVDQAAMEGGKEQMREANINPDEVFKYKPSLVKAQYNKLTDEQRAIVDTFLTVKPGTPSLKIELPANAVADAVEAAK